MTDVAAALAASLSSPQTELQLWEALPASDRAKITDSIASSNPPRYAIAPNTPEGLAAAMAVASEEGLWVLPYGNGTKLHWGGTFREVDLLASTRNLNRIVEHAVGDLTLTVEAGATLGDIQKHLAAHQQFLPLDPAFPETATIGGILATADTGSWRQRYGGVRDLVLGISIARADGQIAKAGGRVVKNVAGYDLMKLFVGSYGTLGTILQVTLRTFASPETSATVWAAGAAEAIASATSQLRASALTPTAADLLSPSCCPTSFVSSDRFGLIARFQGSAPGVEEQRARFEAIASSLDLKTSICRDRDESDLWQHVQTIARPAQPDPGAISCHFGLQPTAAVAVLGKLEAMGASGLVHLGSGIGRGAIATTDPERVAQVRKFCQRHGGYLTILSASKDFKTQIDPWGYTGNALEMMQRLKLRFDPQNVLCPGSFVGGI